MFTAEQLLHPIAPERPSGADLSFSPELDAIAQARMFDDPSLDQGEWVSDLKEADWDFVVRSCTDLLEHSSKDLRLGVWLTEAAARTGHLRGLGEGFKLLAGLCEQYWDRGLYPEADDGDQEQRIGNLGWILSRTPALIREMALTEGRGSAYSTLDFDTARRRATANPGGDNQAGNDSAGLPRLADLEAARRNNSAQFCASFTADAQYCLDALLQLEQACDARLGQDSPGFSSAREAVRDMLHAMPSVKIPAQQTAVQEEHGRQMEHTPAEHDAGAGQVDTGAAIDAPVRAGPPGAITTRGQAIAQLRAVAQFFRRTEPHSPVSYFADKAADAADHDLHTWLRSVVKDQGSLAHIEELLGVQPPA